MPNVRFTLPPAALPRLGATLRRLRKDAGLNQHAMAKRLDTTQTGVSSWETGRHMPTLVVLHRYAEIFGLTVSELLKDVL
ncbi:MULTISPECIES: helix-turn-helix domain-containing protein [unclassified Mycobacterium]|uniref:helix-turn-helix domain-containing protein n=1 Tax=unclassified Mycobacterium TaxID=2642494 RepID=UPI0009EDF28B|nr:MULTISPECIES: helix-turn-helix transcriptional regulator [unclassified Mycobacterium]